MNRACWPGLLTLALLLLPGMGYGDILMRIPGIPGESRASQFRGWIDIQSLGFQSHLQEGTSGELVVSKGHDQASIPLRVALLKGRVLPDITILLRERAAGEERVFAKLELRDVRVISLSESGPSAQGEVLEQLGVSFRQVFYSYESLQGETVRAFVDSKDDVDTDGDGMSDSFEDFHGLNRLVADGDKDSDRDGFTDLEEFRLGLNPRSAASTFRLNAIRPQGGPGLKLGWRTKPGTTYRISVSPSLDKPFQFFREITADTLNEEIDLGQLGLRGFYRVERVGE